MITRLRAIARFWYTFIIGDDWRVAAGVVSGLAVTAVLTARTALPVWWIMILTVLALLPLSIWRAIRDRAAASQRSSSST
jgi:hypothetical protein